MYLLVVKVLFLIKVVNCGVLIVSPHYLEIPSMRLFDEKLYHSLKDSIDNGKIVSYLWELPTECGYFGNMKNTAYLPSVIYYPDDAIELDQKDLGSNCDEFRIKFSELSKEDPHTMYLFINKPKKHKKRSINQEEEKEEQSTITPTLLTTEETKVEQRKVVVNPDEPVLYNSQGKAMLYSSKALLLRQVDESELLLGGPTSVATDDRESFTRLIATVPIDEGKITLRFKFPWKGGYWSLKSVEIGDPGGKIFNLNVTSDITAPKLFSYSCAGITEFTDGNTTLLIHDLQVQPKLRDENRFSDSYNCVPFTTVPIWSGLFVTALLAVGLALGLAALSSIKTMDRFENSKTKQLTITVVGE